MTGNNLNIQVHLIRNSELETSEKVRNILDHVRNGDVVILENGLSPRESELLVKRTMNNINEEFTGIEIESYPEKQQTKDNGGLLNRLFGSDDNETDENMTIVGSANRLETVKKNNDQISTLIKG